MYRTEAEWVLEYQRRNAFWMHSGSPTQAHALLTSGLHSSGFFNSRIVISDDGLLREAASDLVSKLSDVTNIADVDCIVGPQNGATKLAEFLASALGMKRQRVCRWASPAKFDDAGKKGMTFAGQTERPHARDRVFLCEDVITTGESVEAAAKAVEAYHATCMPFVLALVNRSGQKEVNGKRIVALIDRHLPTWTAEECPLCRTGSEPVRPKDNWDRLLAA